jgi:hypothetical protein
MPDEIKVNAAKFDRILGRMLAAKPLSKAEISARVKAGREAKKARIFEEYKKSRKAKRLGQ